MSNMLAAKRKSRGPFIRVLNRPRRELVAVVTAVLSNQPLKCALPPPPHPKHYLQEVRTLPPNYTGSQLTTRSSLPSGGGDSMSTNNNMTCSEKWCRSVDMNTRCRMECCRKHCCLPDGPQLYPATSLFWGLTTIQIIGIVIGSLALLAAIVAILLLLIRRCVPGCHNIKVPTHDTQILVIEGPEEADDSDDPESG